MPPRIENAVDLHCHNGPGGIGGTLGVDGSDRGIPAVETDREAHEIGDAAIVLQAHGFASTALAENVVLLVPGLSVFGGMNYLTGGLNVYAVELALGGLLPTRHRPPATSRWPSRPTFG